MIQKPKVKASLRRVHEIVVKYRQKSSWLFLLRWTVFKRPEPDFGKLDLPLFLQWTGNWDKDAHQLYGIYIGLKEEIGAVRALAAAYEIYQAGEERSRKVYHEMLRKKFKGNVPPKYFQSRQERVRRAREWKRSRKAINRASEPSSRERTYG